MSPFKAVVLIASLITSTCQCFLFHISNDVQHESIRALKPAASTVLKASPHSDHSSMLRREFLASTVSVTILIGSSSVVFAYPAYPTRFEVVGDPSSYQTWLTQIVEAEKILSLVLDNWSAIEAKDNGDEVRRFLGTVGPVSALNPTTLKKAFNGVREAEDFPEDADVVDFTEKYEEVLTALNDAENECYSANFAGFSGGGQLKSSQFIGRAKKRIVVARNACKDIITMLQ